MRGRERKREAETQAEGEAGSMHREPDVGLDPGSPGSHPGPKAGAKPLRHPGIPRIKFLKKIPLLPLIWLKTGHYKGKSLFLSKPHQWQPPPWGLICWQQKF